METAAIRYVGLGDLEDDLVVEALQTQTKLDDGWPYKCSALHVDYTEHDGGVFGWYLPVLCIPEMLSDYPGSIVADGGCIPGCVNTMCFKTSCKIYFRDGG